MQRQTIRRQLNTVAAVVVLSFVVVGILTAHFLTEILISKNAEYTQYTTDKYAQEVRYIHNKAQAVMNFLQYSAEIHSYFEQEQTSNEYAIYRDMDEFLTSVYLIYPELDDIALLGRRQDRTKLRGEDIQIMLERYNDKQQTSCVGIFVQKDDGRPSTPWKYEVLAFVSNLYGTSFDNSYAKPVGQCILTIRIDELMYEDLDQGETSFFLVDSHGVAAPLNANAKNLETLPDEITEESFEGEKSVGQYLLISKQIDDCNIRIVSCTDKNSLLSDVGYMQWLLFLICGMSVALLFITLILIHRSLVRPIYALHYYMHEITSGNYTHIKKKIQVNGNCEMQELAADLNALIDEFELRSHRLFETTERMYGLEIEKQKAEISFLRSQINPHFLYNSLETIRGLCNRGGLFTASGIATALGKIFRYSIKGGSTVKLRDEIDAAKAYIGIQSARFSDKVQVIYHFDPDTLEVPVIKMVLQPLLENTFKYAVEPRNEQTTLYISSALIDGALVITVYDDGEGISPERLAELRAQLDAAQTFSGTSDHIGLCNVHLRIRMMYGPPYGLTIDSTPNEGTKVTLRLAPKLPDTPQLPQSGGDTDA